MSKPNHRTTAARRRATSARSLGSREPSSHAGQPAGKTKAAEPPQRSLWLLIASGLLLAVWLVVLLVMAVMS